MNCYNITNRPKWKLSIKYEASFFEIVNCLTINQYNIPAQQSNVGYLYTHIITFRHLHSITKKVHVHFWRKEAVINPFVECLQSTKNPVSSFN